MKPLLVVIVGVLSVGAMYLLFFATPSAVTNYPSDGATIVAFGDSLVEGVGATTGNDFVSLASQQIGEPIINLGRSGDTTRDGLSRLDEVLTQNPKIVIVLFGGNDYLRQIPPEETFQNLSTMIESIHETGAIVVLLGVRGGLLTDSYRGEYQAVVNTHNTAFVPDVLDGLFGQSSRMADPIHPNDVGYAIIADRVAPVISELNQ